MTASGVPLTPDCPGCGRALRTGDVEFGVVRHGVYHARCAHRIPGEATIATIGVYVEARHLKRMPGSARKRVAEAELLVPAVVRQLRQAGKVDGAEGECSGSGSSSKR